MKLKLKWRETATYEAEVDWPEMNHCLRLAVMVICRGMKLRVAGFALWMTSIRSGLGWLCWR